ncbi:RNA pseudouridine synthase [Neiella marina]|uniref:RNA pseudouridine synthase n=1 Tax=Neiella holothuriorum TaxID=2870530 RepID=A0ABS7EDU5_9GAMM|nr:RNA pseudouridine synthase [Neiella holothuriorum]MBW8190521.1 RNA pseudouridine synthase [Neiella holothuriorum]
MTEPLEISLTLDAENCQQKASLLLAERSQLSQAKIKDAMQKGAVWLIRGGDKKRLRRASKSLKAGDRLELNYNPQLLEQSVAEPNLIDDAGDYSIWFKPYGLSCQGSRWGDFASINRWVELNLAQLTNTPQRPAFLVHRLDRATSGLMLLAHSKKAAHLFSEMFRKGEMDKRYQAIVSGDFSVFPQNHPVSLPVNDKQAHSVFSLLEKNAQHSLLDVKLLTGRKHQIRQHLAALGYPIVGDRLYGQAQHQTRDLQLQSVSLRFSCPLQHKLMTYQVADHLKLRL